MEKITPCLWFDTEGEEAAKFYTSIFPNSKIDKITHYGSAGPRADGTVMTVEFELDGQPFVALNGGPDFTFSEATSFQVFCETQDDVDSYWDQLADGGEKGPCGWLKDKFGLSWQVIPRALPRLLSDPDTEKAQRVMAAMLEMKKIEIDELERAAEKVAAYTRRCGSARSSRPAETRDMSPRAMAILRKSLAHRGLAPRDEEPK